MEAFQIGPFDYAPGATRRVNGTLQTEWAMAYGAKPIGSAFVPESADRSRIIEALTTSRGEFCERAKQAHAPDQLVLHRWDDATTLDATDIDHWPDGLSACIADDRSELWATVSGSTHRMPVTLGQYTETVRKHGAPPLHWIAGLLSDDVTARDAAKWRAPTSWELRNVVGEGSFTGVTGAQAAALVGVTPQNFRKYTARDGASTRQGMSFAMWHLLLHKLGVQYV